MISEKQYVLESFHKNFQGYKDKPIVIYGLGKNTGEVIGHFPEYHIVGLMDAVRTGDIVFGKKVLDLDEIRALKVKTIIIIARYANLKIIYRRIKTACKKYGISVFDINGNTITDEYKKSPERYLCARKEECMELIDQSDVVSFDIFDTLLMRDVLFPEDIFAIMERRLKGEENISFPFQQERMKAERSLYEKTNPTIHEIYENLKKSITCTDLQIERWINLEIEMESQHLLIRKQMVDCFHYAVSKGKQIYLTSDMYLTSDILQSILKKNGIDIEKDQILVSCETRLTKSNGLFQVLKRLNSQKKLLHIGDNEEADYKSALYAGIQNVFLINSGFQMLEGSCASEILEYEGTLENRLLIGAFSSVAFNDPFLFSHTKGKIRIPSEYVLGHDFIAPIMKHFIFWMLDLVKEQGVSKILLGSRDGYLIKKLLDILKEKGAAGIPEYQYFYTSRSVCALASIENEEDIEYVAGLEFFGTIQELLQKRFKLFNHQILQRNKSEDDLEYILRHKKEIFHNALEERENYQTYIKNQKLVSKEKYGFFDFVSSGSCQLGLSRFTDLNLLGIYFARIFGEKKEELPIKAMYDYRCVYETQEAIMEWYLLLENVLTSFDPTLSGFTKEGTPIFAKESRTKAQLRSLGRIHQGIIDSFKEMELNLWENKALLSDDLKLADTFLKLIGENYSMIEFDYFDENPLIDEFSNKEFAVSSNIMD